MTVNDYFAYLVEQIHTTVLATLDERGLPCTCAVDMMDWDKAGAYFLTARGKHLYSRLMRCNQVALTGVKGADTLRSAALSLQGEVRPADEGRLQRLLEKNPYMAQIYPTAAARRALAAFQIYRGCGEWFDLSVRPVVRRSFTFGGAPLPAQGYRMSGRCTGCGKCLAACPQDCIDLSTGRATILQAHCLRCGNCYTSCPAGAVIKEKEAVK
ncbi:4Fe-4S binding protein [Christensenellaceae bacterium NSJ-44]|uniref:4Fe-4S binding protein n=1 Tax=Luoshenia tenuis TaxID=2763654 RepID=A0A926HKX9_9FIRM|nr:4Fe-4S binding protein [Luoshenia tenuis]MBC8527899.1 4Fe-4S binding protein [Luoshenia tenuis]